MIWASAAERGSAGGWRRQSPCCCRHRGAGMPRPGKWQRKRNSARVRKRWQFTGRGPVTLMARALGSRRAPRRTRPPSIATVAVGSSAAATSSRCSSGLVSRTQRSPSCRPTHAHATPSSACMEHLDETNGSMSASVSSRTERRPAWVSTNGMEHNELTDQGSMYSTRVVHVSRSCSHTCHFTSVISLVRRRRIGNIST